MYYLVPVVSSTVNGQTVNGPKYVTDSFNAVPFGIDGWTVLATDQVLQPAPDLYQFPQDLTQPLQDADITALQTFLQSCNVIPYTWVTTGMLWSDVLVQLCQIALLCQAVSFAAGGTSLFPSGTTLDSPVTPVQVSQGTGKIVGGGTVAATPSALATVTGGTAGPFDLTNVSDTDVISDVLVSVSSQFTSPILLGGSL
jgi:hypothetical protein